ncbi:GGDEF domain-containing protein [Vreelandella andesensis]|uniref:diguanylate cyclase n=1 Tax=Vreelandella andesensis TaxID=447567 RepID=A0A3S0W8S5_9GAMM|nr:GGDEF domain-containing protein [Halomonas andesensis]RUR31983.1 GGDEF domain-containing protein [Halomonas andesensis]
MGLAAVDETLYASLTNELPSFLGSALLRSTNLPSLPAVALQVLEVARSPKASLSDYARVIERDPGLTARLIAAANSVHYLRSAQPTQTSLEATQRLGLDATLATVLSFTLFPWPTAEDAALQTWRRAIVAAVVASKLARQLCPAKVGSAFTLALLQDIGILAILTTYPDEAKTLYAERHMPHARLTTAERHRFGSDHTRVGAWLAAKWGLPSPIVHAIYQSHDGFLTDDMATLCLRLSGPIADAWFNPEPSNALAILLKQLAATETLPMNAVEALFHRLPEQIDLLTDILDLKVSVPMDSQTLLADAQQLLYQHSLTLTARLDAQQQQLNTLQLHNTALEVRSRIDPLTQLANRAWLEQQLKEQFSLCNEQGRTMSVVFIDLDHFKALNDQYGHQTGDLILKRFGKTLASLTRSGDLAGRYGGEEFLIILPDETAQTAKQLAERIALYLNEQPMLKIDQKPLYVTASMGIACLNDGNFSNERELIDAADQSMYFIKRSGRRGISVHGQD